MSNNCKACFLLVTRGTAGQQLASLEPSFLSLFQTVEQLKDGCLKSQFTKPEILNTSFVLEFPLLAKPCMQLQTVKEPNDYLTNDKRF